MERQVLTLDTNPSGTCLVIGLDEIDRQDAIVQVVPLANVAAALAEASPPAEQGPKHHLLTADWTQLIELAERRHNGGEAGYALKLDIPIADEHFAWWEQNTQKLDAEADIRRALERRLQLARKQKNEVLDDLLWATEHMQATGYSERDIQIACDRILSFSVNSILGRLGIPDFPSITNLEEFVAFTLGYNPGDLLYMGFDAHDNRGVVAEVPLDFLMNIKNLVRFGETLGSKDSAKSKRAAIIAACQMLRDFDYAFSILEQKELWVSYVLPLSVVRYPREEVIVSSFEVSRFGLA